MPTLIPDPESATVELQFGALVRNGRARGTIGQPAAVIRGGGADRDAGRRAGLSEHIGVERPRRRPSRRSSTHEPLELVALGHAREVSVLTITGTVRNPASGVKAGRADGRRLAARPRRRARVHQGRAARLSRARPRRRSAVQGQHSGSGLDRAVSRELPRGHRRGSARRSPHRYETGKCAAIGAYWNKGS